MKLWSMSLRSSASLVLTAFLVVAGALSATAADFRVVTYNIHSGLGPSFALWQRKAVVEANLEALADVIVGSSAAVLPDVIGLNEVDFASRRSGWIDQARFLADAIERRTGERFTAIEAETWRRARPGFEVSFGNALLVRHPVVRSASVVLPDGAGTGRSGFFARLLREPRGLVGATIDVGGAEIDVLLTHLDAFSLEDREAQASDLLRRFVAPDRTTVLLGDMNAVPSPLTLRRRFFESDRTYEILTAGPLRDARADDAARFATFPAAAPVWPLDGVFASHDLKPRKIEVIGGSESDHRGLSVDFVLGGEPLLEPAQWRSVSPSSATLAH